MSHHPVGVGGRFVQFNNPVIDRDNKESQAARRPDISRSENGGIWQSFVRARVADGEKGTEARVSAMS